MQHAATPIFGDETFDEVERAVMETPRGRWFLAEYARRIRAGESDMILAAIARLERSVAHAYVAPMQAAPAPVTAMPQPEPAPVSAPEPAAAPQNDTPIDALMARLNAALEETNRTMRAEAEAAEANAEKIDQAQDRPGFRTLEEIDALSPQQRLELFY